MIPLISGGMEQYIKFTREVRFMSLLHYHVMKELMNCTGMQLYATGRNEHGRLLRL